MGYSPLSTTGPCMDGALNKIKEANTQWPREGPTIGRGLQGELSVRGRSPQSPLAWSLGYNVSCLLAL